MRLEWQASKPLRPQRNLPVVRVSLTLLTTAIAGWLRISGMRRVRISGTHSKEQSDDDCPSPTHLVVPKSPNVDVIDNELERHPKHEQKDKTTHLVWHPWHGFAGDEGESNEDCKLRDDSNYDQIGACVSLIYRERYANYRLFIARTDRC
jgi:hypothetical protein